LSSSNANGSIHLSCVRGRASEHAQCHFASSGANQTREGYDFTSMDFKTDIAVLAALG
jgi:hypothetical protein